eukprot:TRINITY_DN1791_c1_g1_i1.p1 TRINITY_DN1791_c1_g1~~TRINITY_DN1791_c1_g1_i1.p1  ORF type:complete len:767 (-),score=110.64 TRINITY_DN1791_c1_g1_i1:391-2691(-)
MLVFSVILLCISRSVEINERRSFLYTIVDALHKRQQLEEHNRMLSLLFSIYPRPVANQMLFSSSDQSPHFFSSMGTTMFIDIVNFKRFRSELRAKQLFNLLAKIHSEIDDIIERFSVDRIRTMGDRYMAVCGFVGDSNLAAQSVCGAALDVMKRFQEIHYELRTSPIELRIGIHCGYTHGIVVSCQKRGFEVIGDGPNICWHVERAASPNEILVSEAIYSLCSDAYKFVPSKIVTVHEKQLQLHTLVAKYSVLDKPTRGRMDTRLSISHSANISENAKRSTAEFSTQLCGSGLKRMVSPEFQDSQLEAKYNDFMFSNRRYYESRDALQLTILQQMMFSIFEIIALVNQQSGPMSSLFMIVFIRVAVLLPILMGSYCVFYMETNNYHQRERYPFNIQHIPYICTSISGCYLVFKFVMLGRLSIVYGTDADFAVYMISEFFFVMILANASMFLRHIWRLSISAICIVVTLACLFTIGMSGSYAATPTKMDISLFLPLYCICCFALVLRSMYIVEISAREELFLEDQQERSRDEIFLEHETMERIMSTILPSSISYGSLEAELPPPELYADAVVIFVTISRFGRITAAMETPEINVLISDVFEVIDMLCRLHGLEPVRTIGYSYLIVGGLDKGVSTPIQRAIRFTKDLHATLQRQVFGENQLPIHARVGMDVGPVVAGVIGTKKILFDVLGDAVSGAWDVQKTALDGMTQVSESLVRRIKSSKEVSVEKRQIVQDGQQLTRYFLRDFNNVWELFAKYCDWIDDASAEDC